MKNITQEYVEGVKDHKGFTVIKAPIVSEAVANWFEENKNNLEVNLFYYIYNLDEKRENEDDFFAFIVDDYVKPLETLVSMQYGYYVQKEASERGAASSAKKEFAKELQNLINDHKGNLSKATVLNYIEQIEDVGIGIYS
ncbi:hypothetical protein CHN65_05765 [Listeria monocytogenes]|nr:hypothetical protein [Listeria monocytogenes]EAF2953284.1 hypothetical protein [Listeria monocytogenes]EAF5523973.1 hypothetical protein [Listeria monocytogenes]EAG4319758.1 hypothetical protein [Listeria monocytogenes]